MAKSYREPFRTEVVVDVGRIAEFAPLTIEVVAKLVAERRERRVERGDPFLEGGKAPTPCVASSLAARLDLIEQSRVRGGPAA